MNLRLWFNCLWERFRFIIRRQIKINTKKPFVIIPSQLDEFDLFLMSDQTLSTWSIRSFFQCPIRPKRSSVRSVFDHKLLKDQSLKIFDRPSTGFTQVFKWFPKLHWDQDLGIYPEKNLFLWKKYFENFSRILFFFGKQISNFFFWGRIWQQRLETIRCQYKSLYS